MNTICQWLRNTVYVIHPVPLRMYLLTVWLVVLETEHTYFATYMVRWYVLILIFCAGVRLFQNGSSHVQMENSVQVELATRKENPTKTFFCFALQNLMTRNTFNTWFLLCRAAKFYYGLYFSCVVWLCLSCISSFSMQSSATIYFYCAAFLSLLYWFDNRLPWAF